MKVKDVMTPDTKAIWMTESLADAAKEMWENDCGVLPIIKDGRRVVGMITDRDICMATAMRDQSPSHISVEEVMSLCSRAGRRGRASASDDARAQDSAFAGAQCRRRTPRHPVDERHRAEGENQWEKSAHRLRRCR